jgi:hypothetical protein
MRGEKWMGSSSIFSGIFGRREIRDNFSRRPSTQFRWPHYARMTLCSTGSPWHQGQLQMMFRIFRVPAFFPCCPSRALAVFRSSVVFLLFPFFSSRAQGGWFSVVNTCKPFFSLFYRLIKSAAKLLPSFLKKPKRCLQDEY